MIISCSACLAASLPAMSSNRTLLATATISASITSRSFASAAEVPDFGAGAFADSLDLAFPLGTADAVAEARREGGAWLGGVGAVYPAWPRLAAVEEDNAGVCVPSTRTRSRKFSCQDASSASFCDAPLSKLNSGYASASPSTWNSP
eukprot:scaffold1411_cov396-Prasinococcus_capsulatus_cf.AAC.2